MSLRDETPNLRRSPAPPAQLLVRGARVLDPRTRLDGEIDVLVRDGEIAELSPGAGSLTLPEGHEVVDGRGRTLLPAFVDPHVHLRTPGQEHKEDLETGTRAAAAGGFGCVLAMPNTDPVVDSVSVLRSLLDAAAREARVPTGFLAAITPGLRGERLTDMGELREAGAVGFTDDGRPVTSAGVLRRALRYQRMVGGVIALHEEDPELSAGGAMHEGAVSARLGIAGIPGLSESTMVARDAQLTLAEGARAHAQHLSARASVEAVAAAKAGAAGRGAEAGRFTAEASPHHLLLCDEDVAALDTRMKMNPPLRSADDRAAIVEGLRDGTIDCVATDHAPHAHDEKEVPFEAAPFGTTGLETAFAALHSGLVRPGVVSLELLVERMTAGGALFGIPEPRIAVGRTAQLTLVDLDAQWTPGEHGWESRSANCCFVGRPLHGRVLLTVAGGAVAFRERSFTVVAA